MKRIRFPSATLVLALLLGLLAAASAQFGTPQTWRAIYQGELAGQPVMLDLTLNDGISAVARLTHPALDEAVAGEGPSDPETGRFELELHNADGTSAGTLEGTRHIDWTDDGASLNVTLTLDGAQPVTGTLERVAQYAYVRLTEGRIEASYAYPRFLHGPRALNDMLEQAAAGRLTAFVEEGRVIVDEGNGLGWGWTQEESVDLMGSAGPYTSLLTSFYYYTGGAHPNSHTESLLVEVEGGEVRVLTLPELFAEGAPWMERMDELVLTDLAAQEAHWVTSGEVKALTLQDLASFTLGPDGLTFHFSPYHMGPYVQGPFTVTLPYEDVEDLAAPGGALAAFAALRH